jgi:Putative auto-transporter adhesin, head GIN domain
MFWPVQLRVRVAQSLVTGLQKKSSNKIIAFYHISFPLAQSFCYQVLSHVTLYPGIRLLKNYKMKKKILFAVIAFFAITHLFAQQKLTYDVNAEKRTVGSFHGIKVATGIQLMISQGSTEEVAVSASNIQDRDKIITEVVNGVLKIYYKKENSWLSWGSPKKLLKAWVSFKNIDQFAGSSGSDTKAEGIIKSTSLSIDMSSGAGFQADISANDLQVELSSGADATVSGNTETLNVKASSGAGFNGFGLSSNTCRADASSGSDIEISVAKEISAEASSGGGIHYKGNAVIKDFTKSSGGSIKKEG